MECKFSKTHLGMDLEMKIGDHTIPRVTWFRYIVPTMLGDTNRERFNHRIQIGQMKWRSALAITPYECEQLKSYE